MAGSIANLLNKQFDFQIKSKSVLAVPAGYSPSEFFVKHINFFLAPYYKYRSDEISSYTGVNFLRHWAYNSQELAKECNIKEIVGDVDSFFGHHYPRMMGVSSMLSEVYRSAFLRTLQYFYSQQLIKKDFYLEYAFSTLPVELSYWKILPNRVPEWWPKLQYTTPKDTYKKEIVQFSFPTEEINKIVQGEKHKIILGLDGTIQPNAGWSEGVLDTSIRLIGFGYIVTGKNIPEAKDLSKEILYKPCHVRIPSQSLRPFNFLESFIEHLPIVEQPIEMMDLILHPLVGNPKDLIINLWQWFRGINPFFILHYQLTKNLQLNMGKNRFVYSQNDKPIAWSHDWSEGIIEKTDLEIPHGAFIEIDSMFLHNYLDEHSLRLGYLVKTTHKFRQHSFDEEKIVEDYQLINVSRIIS